MKKHSLMHGEDPEPMTLRQLRIEIDSIKEAIRRGGRTMMWDLMMIAGWESGEPKAIRLGSPPELSMVSGSPQVSVKQLSDWLDNSGPEIMDSHIKVIHENGCMIIPRVMVNGNLIMLDTMEHGG